MHLNAAQQATLNAAVDTLIPPDDFPGAAAAGVPNYIALLTARDMPYLAVLYPAGLDGLDSEARARYQQSYAVLSLAQQTELIESLMEDEEPIKGLWGITPTHFLGLLMQHTAEGYYSDPGNGANHDRASWKMIGFGDGPDKGIAVPTRPDGGRVTTP